MSASVRISRKTALDLALLLADMGHIGSGGRVFDASKLRAQLVAALAPKRSDLAHARRVRAKKRTRKEVVANVRAKVFARADGECDYCHLAEPTEWEHPFGRVRVKESTETTLAVCRDCHVDRTRLAGGAIHWWGLIAYAFSQYHLVYACNLALDLKAKHEAKAHLERLRKTK